MTTAARPVAPGTVLDGKYRIGQSIGEGGMAQVFAAHNEQLDIDVAIKVLRPEHALDQKLVARFVREARVATRIESEHVAIVRDFGVCRDNGTPYIAFELLKGEDLGHMLAATGPFPIPVGVDYMMQALEGVAAAHVQGILHRDLKPTNIFRVHRIGKPALIKVLDFGVAKAIKGREIARSALTSTSTMVGSPLYMAPEQLRGSKHVDARADIWALGVTLYELLTGHPPFDAPTLGALLSAVMEGAPVPPERYRPDVPPGLAAVLLRCMQRDRDRRFQSVRELATELAPFGTESALASRVEIDSVFTDETVRAGSDPDLMSAYPEALAGRSGAPARPQTHPAPSPGAGVGTSAPRPVLIALAALGVILVLSIAGAVGFFMARR